MNKMVKHPLRIAADAFRQALLNNGFTLFDNGTYPELQTADLQLKIFDDPEAIETPVLLQDGEYTLRTSILPYALARMKGDMPLKAAAFGKVFDGADTQYPAHLRAEGIYITEMTEYDIREMWKKIVRSTLGADHEAELIRVSGDNSLSSLAGWGENAIREHTLAEGRTYAVTVRKPNGESFILAHTGTMRWIGAALAGYPQKQENCYAFSADIDRLACQMFGLERPALFDNRSTFLQAYPDRSVSLGGAFEDRCRDVLRTMGYEEGFGLKIYPDGIYRKMNMIQDSWDLNNRGVLLKEALGEGVGLPTVLTPAIEGILAEKYAAGEKNARCFEISHIFIPRQDGHPIEKLALSFGAYGEDTDQKSFTAEVDRFLTAIGNKNHFFIPNNMAIAYTTGECRLILDEKMSYLGGNFGGISEKAEANFGIGVHAYMANLELLPLENKAAEEYGYIAPELR